MKKWIIEEVNVAIELLKNGNNYESIAKTLNRTTRSVERKLNDLCYKSKYREFNLYEYINCKCCDKSFRTLKSEKRVFCSIECSIDYLNKNKNIDYNRLKEIKCIECGKIISVKINTSSNIKCKECKEHKHKCKYCGDNINNGRITCDDCFKFIQNIKLYKKLSIYEENKKLKEINEYVVDIFKELYFNKMYSRLQMSEILNIDKKTLYKFFRKHNFNLRTQSESIQNAIFQNRLILPEIKNQYKTGYHLTWENKKVWYRSSYELDFCKELDKKNIKYDVEKIRIKYLDSTLNKYRVAIPDFYLPETNELIEIKSSWTYKEQEMNDKIISYKENGYSVKLILEHVEYIK